MKRQIDSILLGALWLIAWALGTSFWFNTQFGFNIFSASHWNYLAALQSSGTSVRTLFYVSLILAAVIAVGGMYLLIAPRRRRIRIMRTPQNTATADTPKNEPDASTIDLPVAEPEPTQPANAPQPADTRPQMARPPRLNLGGMVTTPVPASAPAPATMPMADTQPAPKPSDFADIKKIFTDAGYVVKDAPRIAGLRPALFAIGGNETLWMGAVDTPAERMAAAVDRLNGVFTDTLDDIKINIHAFVIGTGGESNDNVMKFDSINALGNYVATHPAIEIPPESSDDFDAYSEYIDTVANYLNKV